MRTAFAILCTGMLLVFALSMTPAAAGGYYSNGYYGGNGGYGYYGGNGGYGYYGGGANVWYSSSCCYRRVVRHVSVARYVPADSYRYGYYGGGYRYGYYGRPYVGYYGQPYRYGYYGGGYRYGGGYYVGRGYGGYYGGGYDAYNAAPSAHRRLSPRLTGR